LKWRLDKPVFGNQNYVIAFILDPNQKLHLFQLRPEQQYKFGFSLLSADQAKEIITSEYQLLKPEIETSSILTLVESQKSKTKVRINTVNKLLEKELSENCDDLKNYLSQEKETIELNL